MTRAGRTLLTAAATALALAVAGCGGSGDGITIGDPGRTTAAPITMPPVPPPSTPPATGSSAPGTTPSPTGPEQSAPSTDRCHTSEVRVTFGPLEAGAGQRMGVVILQNVSKRTCTVYGYGGLQLLDAHQRPLPIGLTREPTPPPTLLRVPPSGKVYKDIRFTVIPSDTEKCPTPAAAQVTPPDETDHLVVPWPYGPVCGAVMGRAYRQSVAG